MHELYTYATFSILNTTTDFSDLFGLKYKLLIYYVYVAAVSMILLIYHIHVIFT